MASIACTQACRCIGNTGNQPPITVHVLSPHWPQPTSVKSNGGRFWMTLDRGLLSANNSVPPGRSSRLHSLTCRQGRGGASGGVECPSTDLRNWAPPHTHMRFSPIVR